ncbi:MAG TPA: FumA C-terminus/TtdB family hydratase beta subunit [Blastocatellia bacterium]|nr:FumA C-terminus/TtdB family hydratase beta subunit [Blastocatellia bacterium]HMY76368.1 FumA C-terminus/TtdB family hydratase beta subunit [Blastocatellia bacterium]HMZ22932.1 FumA C-terminus/TtdB family hydratase beta subunit [Blastocatellia bacterium]HNG32902.1 FumA C-terminus/TtdB family hydratase beta subunit [Blastocatellia bacterium]
MDAFRESMLQLITHTSTNLPPDVRRAMSRAMGEEQGGRSLQALNVIATNIDMACDNEGPICQDTGWPTFEIKTPVGANQIVMKKEIRAAVAEATKRGKLRTNSVNSLTGENASDNLGPGTPTMHFDQWENEDEIEVKLLLKGGGCENKNIQYSLPMEIPHLGKAGRDLDGVRKCLLHAVWQAQGQGCSAGAIGVCIGGDRAQGYLNAKEQLFRTLDDVNPIPELAKLEDYIVQTANTLGIGTMGFGGGVTLIGCKIGVLNRLPASFFVSVAYDCWAFRRLGVVLDAKTGEIKRWLYRDAEQPAITMSQGANAGSFAFTGNEKVLRTPLTEEQVRSLEVGDVVLVTGEMYTGRDAVHAHLMKHDPPADLNGSVLYHCGPVVLKDGDKYQIKAAGPTTSIREEPYQGEIIKRYGVRAVVGKGGMGAKTLAAMKEHGAVYLNAIGGAAQYYAKSIDEVLDVNLLEFGIPEAMWHLRVTDFPAIVTMDAHGNSLHADVEKASAAVLAKLSEPVF